MKMKKFKRFFAVFMSAVILLSSMAISSFAATSKIKSVDINVDVAPGINMSDYDEYITINTPGVSIEEDSVYVYDCYNDVTIVGGEFEKCGSYSLSFKLLVDSGYSWSKDVFEGAIVNGDYVDCWFGDDDDILYVEYYFNLYGSVTDIDLTLDVYGEMYECMYDRYIIFNSYGLCFNDVKFDAVNAYDADGNEVDEFVAGEDYTLEMFFEPENECYFEKDEAGNFVMNSVTVNGEPAEYSIDSYNVNGYFEYIKVTAQVTAKSANIIKDISFDIDENLEGVVVNDVEDYVTIKTDGLRFRDYYKAEAIDSSIYEYASVLQKGTGYYLTVYFTPEDGYFLPFDGCIDSVTINGKANEDVSCYVDYSYEEEVYIVCIEMDIDLTGTFFDQIVYCFRFILDAFRSFISELIPW